MTYAKLLTGFALIFITQMVAGLERTQSSWNLKCGMDIFLGCCLFICLICTRKVSRVICSKRIYNADTNAVESIPLRVHLKNKLQGLC